MARLNGRTVTQLEFWFNYCAFLQYAEKLPTGVCSMTYVEFCLDIDEGIREGIRTGEQQ
jgi:hypothetical protein